MNEPIKGRISREALQEWLNGSTPLLQAVKPGSSETWYTFVKIPQQENVDFIFGQENDHSPGVGWYDKFGFCGAYSRQTQMLRLTDAPLTHIVDGLTPEEYMDSEDLLRQVNAQVNARVEEIIGNDRENLPVQKLTSEPLCKKLREYRELYVEVIAIQMFFNNSSSNIQFHSQYAPDHWTEEGITSYLTNPDGYIQAQAESYIAQNGENLLEQFLENDALAEVFGKIETDTGSTMHKMRAITQAVEQCGARTVTVTVEKDGVELTFKTAAKGLKGNRNCYSRWDIPAADRREFQALFGHTATYSADDITKITYGRNTIYEAPPAPAEELTEDIGLGGMSL